MKLMKKIIVLTLIVLLIFLSIKIFKVQNIILEKIYPIKYEKIIEKCAEEYEVDKNYLYAIIKVESNFDENVNSKSGAKGLMQIMDATAQDIVNQMDSEFNKEYNLYDPETNIIIGTKYFADLLKEYKNEKLALAAYNAGKGNVNKWIENGIIKADCSDIENIPFKETNMYVRKILQSYKIYQELYM